MAQPQPSPPRRPATEAAAHALVIDDSLGQRRIVSALLRKWGYRVSEAASGQEALVLAQDDPPDVVVSDWMMPGMDGLALCRAFRGLERKRYGYFILLTSKSEKGEIAQGLDAGADDFLTKPVSAPELRARLTAGERILRMERELTEKNTALGDALDRLQAVNDAIEQDLRQAKSIQTALVPETQRDFGRARIGLLLKPCGHVGGDLVGMFSPGHGHIGVYCIDVSGHGITSAMMTARVAGYLSAAHPEHNLAMELRVGRYYALLPPERVAGLLNDRLSVDAGVEEYFTMIYAVLDQNTGLLRFVQAGHPPPLVIRADGRCVFIGDGGLPIGLIPGVTYETFECQLTMGDRVLFYSDGITECPTETGMLEQDGLLRLVQSLGPGGGTEWLDDLYWRLAQHLPDGVTLPDDVSAALLEYTG